MLTASPPLQASRPASWRVWLETQALPLWSDRGFDTRLTLFHERLAWNGDPLPMAEMRLMVQARQISTYCRAALDGVYDAGEQALRCLDTVERLYRHADGQPGWIFSLTPDGSPANRMRDLYAHAFVLFTYAWAYKLTGDSRHLTRARETSEEIVQIFSAENGGFFDSVPAMDSMRRQNPHMHLLEAHLAMFEVSGDSYFLDQARGLIDLALGHLVDEPSGMLFEFFAADWSLLKPRGTNRVEPGHLFEWAWLLGEYRRLAVCDTQESVRLDAVAERLFQAGWQHGRQHETGLVFDAMTEDGAVFERSTRIWPQTELMRLLAQRARPGEEQDMLGSIGTMFFERYVPTRLAGGWIDRLDVQQAPLVDYMPASTLYHIYGAAREFI